MPREHGDGGTFVETVSLEDVLGVFDAVDGPVILSADVADALGCSRETARRKLQTLHDRGDLARRKVSRRVIYWDPNRTADTVGRTQEASDTRRADTDTARDAGTETPYGTSDAESDDLAGEVRAYLEENDAPPKTEHGRGAVLDVFRELREHGTMKTGALQDAVYANYTDDWSDARTMWNGIDRYLEDVPGVEKGGYGKWTYADDDAVRAALADV